MEKLKQQKDAALGAMFARYIIAIITLLLLSVVGYYLFTVNYYSPSGTGVISGGRIAKATEIEAYEWARSDMESGYFNRETVPEHLDVIILNATGEETFSKCAPSYEKDLRAFMTAMRTDGSGVSGNNRQIYAELINTYETAYIHYSLIADHETLFLALFILICVLDILIPTMLFIRKIRKSIRTVSTYAREINAENLDVVPQRSGIREMNEIIDAVDFMKVNLVKSTEEKWIDEQKRKDEKAQIAHDLKTPLTIIRGNADLLMENSSSDEDREAIQTIIENSERIARSILEILE